MHALARRSGDGWHARVGKEKWGWLARTLAGRVAGAHVGKMKVGVAGAREVGVAGTCALARRSGGWLAQVLARRGWLARDKAGG